MTNTARQLIDAFETLPETEKHEVVSELLRRLLASPYPSPSEEGLTQAADAVFEEYDRREASE